MPGQDSRYSTLSKKHLNVGDKNHRSGFLLAENVPQSKSVTNILPPREMTILWTFQNPSVLDILASGETFFPNPDMAESWGDVGDWGFGTSYEWMVEQMKKRIGSPPSGFFGFPLWAWEDHGTLASGRPDLRSSRPKEESVLIEFDAPEGSFLKSDFGLWHHVLNYWPISESEEAEEAMLKELSSKGFDPYATKPLPESWAKDLVEGSWDRIFRLDLASNCDGWLGGGRRAVQACLWGLCPSTVRKTTFVPTSGPCKTRPFASKRIWSDSEGADIASFKQTGETA